jgi:hypothetical protein
MTAKFSTVKFTANFEANLAEVEAFLEEAQAGFAYDALLIDLADTVIPNLERYPRLGRSFLERKPQSVEARVKLERLRAAFADADLREYLSGDYLLLYALIDQTIYWLSIKHHRQLSFDFEHLWAASQSGAG